MTDIDGKTFFFAENMRRFCCGWGHFLLGCSSKLTVGMMVQVTIRHGVMIRAHPPADFVAFQETVCRPLTIIFSAMVHSMSDSV